MDRPGAGSTLPVSTWVGIAVIGALLFVFGVWAPAWKGVPYGGPISYAAAAAGAGLFIVGLTFADRARRATKPTPLEEMPGVEVYSPAGARVAAGAETEDDRP